MINYLAGACGILAALMLLWRIRVNRINAKLKDNVHGRCKHGAKIFGVGCERCRSDLAQEFAQAEAEKKANPWVSIDDFVKGDVRARVPWPKRPEKIQVMFTKEKEIKFDFADGPEMIGANYSVESIRENIYHTFRKMVCTAEVNMPGKSEFDSFCKKAQQSVGPERTWVLVEEESFNTAPGQMNGMFSIKRIYQECGPIIVTNTFRVGQWIRNKARGGLGLIVQVYSNNTYTVRYESGTTPYAELAVNLEPAVPRVGEWWRATHDLCPKCGSVMGNLLGPLSIWHGNPHAGEMVADGCLEPVHFGKN